eukprot:TRINITY_DN9767_c1_g1_i10.p1 TRINITY_DN9767_c1_g1~~TRINITY_DN9767_c1_g1_i10.p1  ORF type:complete len:271 (+),score=89.23 TRINITY_DN9767_c1_g1_i10:58-813(+)
MAVGKNKRLSKGGKKGGAKKKAVDFMTRKEWYDVVAPAKFDNRICCKTLASKTVGNKLGVDNVKGRVFEVSHQDLSGDEQHAHRKIRLRVDEVQGRMALTNFHGMDLTTDKLRSLVKKWCTLIEARSDTKTTDGYTLRMFAIGFTDRRENHVKKNCYAQTSKVRRIKRKMIECMRSVVSKNTLEECVKIFTTDESIGKDIQRATKGIYPLRDVYLRKVKVLRMPKLDVNKLLEIHGELPTSLEDLGMPVEE